MKTTQLWTRYGAPVSIAANSTPGTAEDFDAALEAAVSSPKPSDVSPLGCLIAAPAADRVLFRAAASPDNSYCWRVGPGETHFVPLLGDPDNGPGWFFEADTAFIATPVY